MGDYIPDLSVAGQELIADRCEHDNEYSGSTKCGEFNDYALASEEGLIHVVG
jgi:hypothetical protein